MFWNTPKMWNGETCFILGGGTSIVKQFKIPDTVANGVHKGKLPPRAYLPYMAALQPKLVIGINKAYEFGGLVDILFWGDAGFWAKYKADILKFEGLRVTCMTNVKPVKGVKFLEQAPVKIQGLFLKSPSVVSFNRNSGAAAINLAIHLGSKKIVLLGFDMCKDQKKKQHWHNYYKLDSKLVEDVYARQMEGFDKIQADAKQVGVEILNANPESAITTFKKVNLEEVLDLPNQICTNLIKVK